VAAYDYDACIKALERDMSYEEAVEYFDFNTIGAWVGESTPVFIVTGAAETSAEIEQKEQK
jgi:hypothetical protein